MQLNWKPLNGWINAGTLAFAFAFASAFAFVVLVVIPKGSAVVLAFAFAFAFAFLVVIHEEPALSEAEGDLLLSLSSCLRD